MKLHTCILTLALVAAANCSRKPPPQESGAIQGAAVPPPPLPRPAPGALGRGTEGGTKGRGSSLPPADPGPRNLSVPGLGAAVSLSPSRGRPPWPVILVLHGNFDRPEWECETWAPARAWGHVLCTRGRRRRDVPRRMDRWTYPGAKATAREVQAALRALRRDHPGRVKPGAAVVVGFSLGAIYAARVVRHARLPVRGLVLVEGGTRVSLRRAKLLRAGGLGRVAYLCGSMTACGRRAKRSLGVWRRAGVEGRMWVMRGVGHGYPNRFAAMARAVLGWILGPPR